MNRSIEEFNQRKRSRLARPGKKEIMAGNRIQKIKSQIEEKLKRHFGRTFENATDEEIFQTVALSIREMILEQWVNANQEIKTRGRKKLCYLRWSF